MSREPVRCKLEINRYTEGQVMEMKYLRIILSVYGDVEKVEENQTEKANRVAGWKNKHVRILELKQF